jgi:Sec-independent protein translocase protein TatA
MRSLGQGIVEFKKGVQGIEDDVKNADKNKIEHK